MIMKKLISVIFLTVVLYHSGQSARIITSQDIARWYLDADLVLICNINRTDTLKIAKFDSLQADGFHFRYDILREKYQISVDSILKGEQNLDEMADSIFTPEFSSSSRREKIEFTGFNSNGDSTFLYTIEDYSGYDDYSYFRINSFEKRVVILRKSEIGYVIDYQSKCDSSVLNLLREVELKGENFFGLQLSQIENSNNFRIYPNPFTDQINIEGIQAKRIEITDMNGKTNAVEIQNPHHIDLSYLNRGMYFITFFTEKDKWTQKIIKE